MLHLAWRWDGDVLIKIGHTANIQPERMAERLPQQGGEMDTYLISHHPRPAGRLGWSCGKEQGKQRILDLSCHYIHLWPNAIFQRISSFLCLQFCVTSSTDIRFLKSNREITLGGNAYCNSLKFHFRVLVKRRAPRQHDIKGMWE